MYITDIQCYPPGKPVPIIIHSSDQTAVEGGKATFYCIFKDNYLPLDYTVYWTINNAIVWEDSNYSDYYMTVSQHCPSDNVSCCQFITELKVITAALSLDGTTVECTATIHGVNSSHGNQLGKSKMIIITIAICIYKEFPVCVFNCAISSM